MQTRQAGGNAKFELRSSGEWGDSDHGVMQFNINNTPDGGSEISSSINFHAAAGNIPFVRNEFYHVLIGWTDGLLKIVVNRAIVKSETIGTPYTGDLVAIGIGATSSGVNNWIGDIGHFWASFSHYEDPELAATQDKFVIDGVPQNLGPNGELVTGSAPEIYCDGDGAGWNNRGTAGALTVTGELTASATAPGYTV